MGLGGLPVDKARISNDLFVYDLIVILVLFWNFIAPKNRGFWLAHFKSVYSSRHFPEEVGKRFAVRCKHLRRWEGHK